MARGPASGGRGASVARSCARARARLALGPARAPARLAAFALAVRGLLLRRADRVRPWHLPDAARLQRDVAEAAGSCRGCCSHGRGRVVRAGPDSGPVALVPAHAGLAAGSLAQGGQVQVPVEPAAAQRGARDEHQPQRGRADGCEQPIRFFLDPRPEDEGSPSERIGAARSSRTRVAVSRSSGKVSPAVVITPRRRGVWRGARPRRSFRSFQRRHREVTAKIV